MCQCENSKLGIWPDSAASYILTAGPQQAVLEEALFTKCEGTEDTSLKMVLSISSFCKYL